MYAILQTLMKQLSRLGRVRYPLAVSHLSNANAHMSTNNLKKNVITTSHIKHRQTPFSLLGLKQMMQYFCCDFSKMIRVLFYFGDVWCFKNIFSHCLDIYFFNMVNNAKRCQPYESQHFLEVGICSCLTSEGNMLPFKTIPFASFSFRG